MSSEKINLDFDDKYRDLRDILAEKYFEKKNGMRDAGLFALALGIRLNKRVPRDKWEGKPISWTDMDRLKSQIGDFEILFDYMDVEIGEGVPYLLEEFLTGGLKYIEDNALGEDGNFCELPFV